MQLSMQTKRGIGDQKRHWRQAAHWSLDQTVHGTGRNVQVGCASITTDASVPIGVAHSQLGWGIGGRGGGSCL